MKRLILTLLLAAVLGGSMLALPVSASAQPFVGISVRYAPPPLLSYPQPLCPGPNYIWVPGYWGWGPWGYYWIPGTWVMPPVVGLLWTPGYWDWEDGSFWWRAGYWGPRVGFYGGIDYGYGYPGDGFDGGYWRGNWFYYNRAVADVDDGYIYTTFYRRENTRNRSVRHVSYHGGRGGMRLRPTASERTYARERHIAATVMQRYQARYSLDNPTQRFASNQRRPQIAATTRPAVFTGSGVVTIDAQHNAYVYRGARMQPIRYRTATRAERRAAIQPLRRVVTDLQVASRKPNYDAAPAGVPGSRSSLAVMRRSELRMRSASVRGQSAFRAQPPGVSFRRPAPRRMPARMQPDRASWSLSRHGVSPTQHFQSVRFTQRSRPPPRFVVRRPLRRVAEHGNYRGRPPS